MACKQTSTCDRIKTLQLYKSLKELYLDLCCVAKRLLWVRWATRGYLHDREEERGEKVSLIPAKLWKLSVEKAGWEIHIIYRSWGQGSILYLALHLARMCLVLEHFVLQYHQMHTIRGSWSSQKSYSHFWKIILFILIRPVLTSKPVV